MHLSLRILNCGHVKVVQVARMYVLCMKCQIDIGLFCYVQMGMCLLRGLPGVEYLSALLLALLCRPSREHKERSSSA